MKGKVAQRVLYLLVVVMLAAACRATGTPTPVTPAIPPTPTLPPGARLATSLENIAGTWVGLGSDRMYQRFNTDGTCFTSVSLEKLNTSPAVESTCRFEGDELYVTQTGGTGALPSCGSRPGRYYVHLLANGNITFVRIFEHCAPRGRSTAMEHERVP
jgi:hypothetical protein